MSADDVKPWIDLLVTLLTGGGVGGILLAVIGWMKAKHEKPDHIAASPAPNGIAQQIGGMVMSQSATDGLIAGLNSLASSHTLHTSWCQSDAKERREWCEAQRRHERELAEGWHRDVRHIGDILDTLNKRLDNLPGCGGA